MKAYHFVLGGAKAIDKILSEGEILPAIYRLDPHEMQDRCLDVLDTFEYAAQKDPSKEAAVVAVKELIDERIGEIYVAQDQIPSVEGGTRFRCEDLLAGDLGWVFLSPKDWAYELYGVSFHPNGFVFNVRTLLKEGGMLRNADLISLYELAMTDLVWGESYDTVTEAKRVLENKLTRIQAGHETNKIPVGGPPPASELVFPGALPVEWAVEIWRDGERI